MVLQPGTYEFKKNGHRNIKTATKSHYKLIKWWSVIFMSSIVNFLHMVHNVYLICLMFIGILLLSAIFIVISKL